MEGDTLKRLDRLVAILIRLQSRRVVRAQDLADRFRVSLRTIYRDIRTLEASGVPVVGEAGSGYSLMEGYHLPPVLFTREEATSFVAAEKFMERFTDPGTRQAFGSALAKIKAVLRTGDKAWMESLEDSIRIRPGADAFNPELPDAMESLFESIAERRQVEVDYRSIDADSSTRRRIEPVGLFHENGFWYVYGYCHLRRDYRQFRTDRIQGIRLTQEAFARKHEPLDAFLDGRGQTDRTRVRIAVDRRIARYLEHARKRHGFVSEEPVGDRVEMTFLTCWMEQDFARWYLTFGDFAQILEPDRLKRRVTELLRSQLDNLERESDPGAIK